MAISDQPARGKATRSEASARADAEIRALYTRLVEDHHRSIYNYVVRIVGEPALAEDLTQETFLRAYRALGRLPEDANHRAWLFRIATNAATDEIRRRKRRPLELLGLAPTLRAAGESEDQKLGRMCLTDAMAELDVHHRIILNLFEFGGLNAPEVAEALGIRAEAARKRRQRARQALARILRAPGAGGDAGWSEGDFDDGLDDDLDVDGPDDAVDDGGGAR